MSACESLVTDASAGAAPALRAVDCLANETAAAAFGRLFGGGVQGGGALLPALTVILTLYIAFFAISLLTGRSRLGISALTPRMITLGLVLTFATSWAAYQGVVWNLATGAPDQIAGILMGASGSATQLFADRVDIVFAAIAEVSGAVANAAQPVGEGAAQAAAQAAPQGAATGSFTPGNLMWLGALLLLLGTVGVLVTARIALAVLLALGPVFVVFALFPGTRGLFAGWLRGVVMTAVTPLFAVLGGAFMLELVVPVVAELRGVQGIDGRASMALFTIAVVHIALMAMVLKVAGTMVSAWQVFGLVPERGGSAADAQGDQTGNAALAGQAMPVASATAAGDAAGSPATRRPALMPATLIAANDAGGQQAATGAQHWRSSQTIVNHMPAGASDLQPLSARRARGIGSRFASRPNQTREMVR